MKSRVNATSQSTSGPHKAKQLIFRRAVSNDAAQSIGDVMSKNSQTLGIDPELEELIHESRLTPDQPVWLPASMDDLPKEINLAWDIYVAAHEAMIEAKAEVKDLVTVSVKASGQDILFAPKELTVKFAAPFTKAPELGWGYVPAKPKKAGKAKRTFSLGAVSKRKAS